MILMWSTVHRTTSYISRKADLILYEPFCRIEIERNDQSQEFVRDFTTLVEKFSLQTKSRFLSSYEVRKRIVYPPKNESDDWSNIAKSGAVSYIDSHATRRNLYLEYPEFQGHRTLHFSTRCFLKPLKNDIVF